MDLVVETIYVKFTPPEMLENKHLTECYRL